MHACIDCIEYIYIYIYLYLNLFIIWQMAIERERDI